MQPPEEKGKLPAGSEASPDQDLPLSATWRALLGLQDASKPTGEEIVQVEPLASDPWSHLQQAQGMQPVDLQKIRLHDLHLHGDDEDVEHALNLMREATGQLPALKPETREA